MHKTHMCVEEHMCVPESVSWVLPFDLQLQCRQEAVDQGDLSSHHSPSPPVFLTVSFLFTCYSHFKFLQQYGGETDINHERERDVVVKSV